MSLLRSILLGCIRPYTCLTVPKFKGVEGAGWIHTSARLTSSDPSTSEVASEPPTSSRDREAGKDKPASVNIPDDFRPGKIFPTADVYDQTFGGVRFDELPKVCIFVTRNNTKAGAYTFDNKKTLVVKTGGMVGFKNASKRSNIAAQTVGLSIGQTLMKKGVKNVRVEIKGTSLNRLASIKGVQMAGVNIVSITDKTHPCFSLRPKKERRT